MPNRERRRLPLPLILALPLLLSALFLAVPWGLHRLAENGLLPGDVIGPDAALAVWTAGTPAGDWLVWRLDPRAEGASNGEPTFMAGPSPSSALSSSIAVLRRRREEARQKRGSQTVAHPVTTMRPFKSAATAVA